MYLEYQFYESGTQHRNTLETAAVLAFLSFAAFFSFNSRDGSAAAIRIMLCIVQMELVLHTVFHSLSEPLHRVIQRLA